MVRNCQACGSPMFSRNDMGMNQDGTFNKDFCSSCYRRGEFTSSQGNNQMGFTNYVYPYVTATGFGVGNQATPFYPPFFVGDRKEYYGD